MDKLIFIFGASNTWGMLDSEGGGWTDRLKQFFLSKIHSVEEDYVLVHNLGIDGNTSTDILARFENEIKLRLWPDCKSLIAAARKYTEKILFLGFSPSDESKTTPLLWDANLFYRNDRAKLYNGLIEKITKEEKVFFVNLRDVFEKDTPKYLCFDGLHLNSQGHKKFFELVRDFLKENKIL